MINKRQYLFKISLFISLFSIVFLLANINKGNFFQSEDFERNVILLSVGDIGIEKALIYPLFHSLMLPMIEPVTFLLLVWSLVPSIIIYFTVCIFKRLLKDIAGNKLYMLIFILSCPCFYFSLGHLLFFEFVPTAHLLFQSVASVFFLLTLWFWFDNRKFSILFFMISLSMHYVVIIYFLILLLVNYFYKNQFGWFGLLGGAVFGVFLYYAIILGFSILRMGEFIMPEMPSMGVEDISMLYISALVTSLGLVVLFFFRSVFDNLINRKNITFYYKKINYIYAYSLIHVAFSLITAVSSPGIGYRMGFLVYVWSPLLISLLPAIGILLLGGLLKTTGRKEFHALNNHIN